MKLMQIQTSIDYRLSGDFDLPHTQIHFCLNPELIIYLLIPPNLALTICRRLITSLDGLFGLVLASRGFPSLVRSRAGYLFGMFFEVRSIKQGRLCFVSSIGHRVSSSLLIGRRGGGRFVSHLMPIKEFAELLVPTFQHG